MDCKECYYPWFFKNAIIELQMAQQKCEDWWRSQDIRDGKLKKQPKIERELKKQWYGINLKKEQNRDIQNRW